jgi:hypothetical protein
MEQQNPRNDEKNADILSILRKIILPIHPRLFAYLLALLYVCLLGAYETHRVDVWQDSIPVLPEDNPLLPYRRAVLFDPDSQRWVIYAQESYKESSVRLVHWTNDDGYPSGRYVGWSTPPMWWLESLAWVRHEVSGQDMISAIDEVAPFYNPFLWILAATVMGAMTVLAFGWRGSMIIPLLYSMLFASKYGAMVADHHLFILLSGLGTLICFAAPFYKEKKERAWTWFAGAAAFSSFGMWISAPSQALVLVGIGVGMLFLPSEAARKVDGALWRMFGYISALLALAIYWWEFRPDTQFNVELNNPMYAAATFVFGIWMWQLHEFSASGRRWDSLNQRALLYSGILMLIFVVELVVYLPYCFSLADPYHSRWVSMIAEDQPVDIKGFIDAYGFFFTALFAAIVGLFMFWDEVRVGMRAALVFCAALAATYGWFGVSSNRFTEVMLAAMAVVVALAMPSKKQQYAAWLAAGAVTLSLASALHSSSVMTRAVTVYGTPDQLGGSLNLRTISSKILRMHGTSRGGLLTHSDEGNTINYYTGIPVYGTAYWENNDGLIFMSRVFFAEEQGENRKWKRVRLMMNYKNVRYIVIAKNMSYNGSYMIYGKDRIVDSQYTFASYLIKTEKDKFVPWLKLDLDDDRFRVFSIEPLGSGKL